MGKRREEGREGEEPRRKGGEWRDRPSVSSICKCQQPRLGQANARSQDINLGLPRE